MLEGKRIKLGNGIHLNMIETDKFKSNLLSYYFVRPLARREITFNALIPLVLKKGSKNYQTNLEIDKKLEELYGANLSMAVNKHGEKQVIRYTMQWASEKYAKEEGLDKEAVDMLHEMIFNPHLVDGAFDGDYVDLEKNNLDRIIQSKINDKRDYAIERCLDNMCKNERFSNHVLGYSEDIDEINRKNLYQHYKRLIQTSPIEIFYVGTYDDELLEYLKELNTMDREELVYIREDSVRDHVYTKNMVRESLDVNQGKLVVGYRSGIKHDDDLYKALVLANRIFGGGSNSKLFLNVREKESLAYYIASRLYKNKSIILVDSGIEFEDMDKTLSIIDQELQKLKNGEISEEEISIAKEGVKSRLKSIADSGYGITEYNFDQSLTGKFETREEKAAKYDKVTKDEIIEAAKTLTMDTIYFMTNNKFIWSD